MNTDPCILQALVAALTSGVMATIVTLIWRRR
jgi:hypothetical protein